MRYEISISPDKMVATVTLRDDGVKYQITENEVLEALRRAGVRYGVVYENLRKITENPMFDVPMIIARGKPPIDGQDGHVEITIKREEGINSSKIGKVDMREIAAKNRIIVKKGDVIGKLVKPTPGTPGMNVLGETINPKPGRPARFMIGDGIEIKDDGTLVATKSGLLVVDRDSVHVEDTFVVKGDVDYSVGNINFPGKVEIYGDVKPGFVIRARETIKVRGIVEAATIISYEEDVEVTGVKGREKGLIKAKRDVKAKFLESAHVEAGRNVEVDGPISNSVVKAKSKVIASGKKGVIVGGLTLAGRSIEALDIGSILGVTTIVEIGVDPELR